MPTTTRTSPSEAAAATRQLRARLSRSRIVTPEDPGYDEARAVYFTGIRRRPAALVQATDAEEVVRVVSVAADTGVELAVRSGGHSLAGHGVCEGGIVLDVSPLRSLEVDPEGRTAWAGAGWTAGGYTEAVGAHGLATGFGDAPSVGIGGITLGGGVGFLHRKLGLTVDSLLAAEVVTADGRILRVDSQEHPDLFWAIRGGGGNFGVVTRFRFRLHHVDRVMGGMLMLPATPEIFHRFVAGFQAAPEEVSGMVNVMPAPPMPMIPPEHHGHFILLATLVHAGGGTAGERALAPFRALATPIADHMGPMAYPEIYHGAEEHPAPAAVAMRSFFMDAVDLEAAETVFRHLERSTVPLRMAQVRMMGGAVARVPSGATAFPHRERGMMVNVAAILEGPDVAGEHAAWATGFARELAGDTAGAYVGFLGDEGKVRVRQAYPGPTWDRLARIKAEYDPGNLFRMNHNVPPAGRA
jgi:FAD/FMN-containing dehydrogenase